MIPFAQNHITITRDLFYEGTRATESTSYKKLVKFLTIAIAALFAGLVVWFILIGGSIFPYIGEVLFLAILLIWFISFLPFSKRKRKYKALTQKGSVVPTRDLSFYEDYLTITAESGKSADFTYEAIVSLIETEHLYILMTDTSVGLMLDKEGFAKGSIDDIRSHLPETTAFKNAAGVLARRD